MKPFPLIEVSGPAYERGVQHGRACGDLIWCYLALLRQSTIDAAQARGEEPRPPEIIDEDRARVCSAANQVLVDRDQVADIELVPDGPEFLAPRTWDGDYVVHTNHFLSERLAPDEQYLPRLPDSLPRYRRMEALIRERYGRLTLSDLQAFFADHDGFPRSICRHAEAGTGHAMKSIYSVIGEPDRGRLHVSVGNPCESEYFTYEL